MPSPEFEQARQAARKDYRRVVRRQVWLPFLLALAVLVLLILLLAVPTDEANTLRAAAVGDFFYILLVLCPALLCMVMLYVLVVALMIGVQRLHTGSQPPLERLQSLSDTALGRVRQASETIQRGTAKTSVWFAPYIHWIQSMNDALFTPPDDEKPKETADASANTPQQH